LDVDYVVFVVSLGLVSCIVIDFVEFGVVWDEVLLVVYL